MKKHRKFILRKTNQWLSWVLLQTGLDAYISMCGVCGSAEW